jgi:hypothetical protein
MKEWQFDILFFVAVGGAVFLLVAPAFGINTGNPSAATGVGAILAFILTQRSEWTSKKDKRSDKEDSK